jgi:hypothetical protein
LALIQVAITSAGILPNMLIATNKKNNEVRTNRDWEMQEGRAVIKTEESFDEEEDNFNIMTGAC